MPLNWLDVDDLSFNTLLLFEEVQLSWLPASGIDEPLTIALSGNPVVAWHLRHKCPAIAPWVDELLARGAGRPQPTAAQIRAAEVEVLRLINDWVVYAVDPAVYDAQPHNGWDSAELTGLVDFAGKVVVDVGSGTGRQAFVAAPAAAAVYAVEPVANLRRYMREKAARLGFSNFYAVDGLLTAIPFAPAFADVATSGHAYGDEPEAELAELLRVTKPGGMIILCPGNNDVDNAAHAVLVNAGFAWSRFEEPQAGWERKYWKRV